MSLQRRREHFIIICMIKVRVDEVPNDLGFEFHLFQFQFCRLCREGVAVAFKCNMTNHLRLLVRGFGMFCRWRYLR